MFVIQTTQTIEDLHCHLQNLDQFIAGELAGIGQGVLFKVQDRIQIQFEIIFKFYFVFDVLIIVGASYG